MFRFCEWHLVLSRDTPDESKGCPGEPGVTPGEDVGGFAGKPGCDKKVYFLCGPRVSVLESKQAFLSSDFRNFVNMTKSKEWTMFMF